MCDAYFLSLHDMKHMGRNSIKLCNAYKFLSLQMKEDFKSLTVERQMFLLSIPLKKQAKFKRDGVDLYVASARPAVKTNAGWLKQHEKRDEQRKQQVVANGGELFYEDREKE
jgi:very-short-patch-repair endonuclease